MELQLNASLRRRVRFRFDSFFLGMLQRRAAGLREIQNTLGNRLYFLTLRRHHTNVIHKCDDDVFRTEHFASLVSTSLTKKPALSRQVRDLERGTLWIDLAA
jgi:hypothetical protein